jgi:hypothetical protein
MFTRVDRMKANQEKAFRNSRAHRWPQGILAGEPRRNGYSAEGPWEDEAPTLSLARRLERDPRLLGRALHWLLIKGGMAMVLLLGLMMLGLLGGLLGGR